MSEPTESDVLIVFEQRPDWTVMAGDDPRGNYHGQPGDYVVAMRPDGRRLAQVRIDYVLARDGHDVHEYAARQLIRALQFLYYPNPRAGSAPF